MPEAARSDDQHDLRIVLGLLESVERDGEQSQRKMAGELGIALGLVNAYLKRCMTKGLVKAKAVPTRRYAYYLTPKGFAEKSRLAVNYLSASFSFFRQARADCSAVLQAAAVRGSRKIAFLGQSDLTEVAIICAMEIDLAVVAVVDPESRAPVFVGIPVYRSLASVVGGVDAVVVTDLKAAQTTADAAVLELGADRVFAPALLNVRIGKAAGVGL